MNYTSDLVAGRLTKALYNRLESTIGGARKGVRR